MPGLFFCSENLDSGTDPLEIPNGMTNGCTPLGNQGSKRETWKTKGTRIKKRAMIRELMEKINLPQSWK